jgi:hypothetical protein
MLRHSLALSAVAVAALTSACLNEREYVDPTRVGDAFDTGSDDIYVDDGYVDSYGAQLPAVNGRVRGDIGAVRGFDAPADTVDAWYDDGYKSTTVTVSATDAQGRLGMIILDIQGRDLREVPAGTHHFSAYNVDPGLGQDSYVNVTGCSQDPDSYYDSPGNEGDIVIQDTEQGREVTVHAVLPDESYESTTEANGSFILTQ